MESLASLYKNHIATLQERTRDALARFSWMRYLFTPASCSMFFSTIIPIRLK
ncbi:Xaa-Pro dipeptidase [Escherichia coli]|uniref:Xaa-Pro dipeptidase n=1 Tax=Escherichia coli TaxID=562 RepID=A0A377B617_ECOLX|nr:Xaa-Pro dipeptidase [Escherichia coli]